MDELRHTVDSGSQVEQTVDLEGTTLDQLLEEMLQEGESEEVREVALEITQPSPVTQTTPLLPITALDHPSGRAIRQASFAPKTSWQQGSTKGQTQRLYYRADNGIEVSLGTPENPLDLAQARKEIQKLGELTVLIDRLLFWYWNTRRRPRPEDGKMFVGKNGSVPVTIAEIMQMLGYEKHSKREYQGGDQRYTDGYRSEDKEKIKWNISMLSAFQVQGTYVDDATTIPIEIQGAYLRYSIAKRKGIQVGYFISPGDWINTIHLLETPSLMRIDEQIFQFDKQREQHEIRLSLYFAERFRDQAEGGTLGSPLSIPVENQSGKYRLPTMEEILNGALIKIDRNNLTRRFVPRIESALLALQELNIVGQVEYAAAVDKEKPQWGRDWLSASMIITAPPSLFQEYQQLQQVAHQPALAKKRASKSKKPRKIQAIPPNNAP